MVHVVKVVNTHIDARASIVDSEMESKINFRLRVSMLVSKEMNSTAQYSFRTSDRSWHDACYRVDVAVMSHLNSDRSHIGN